MFVQAFSGENFGLLKLELPIVNNNKHCIGPTAVEDQNIAIWANLEQPNPSKAWPCRFENEIIMNYFNFYTI